MHGLGVPDRELLLRRHAVELQSVLADGLDVLGPEIDQRHVLARMGKIAADIATQRADTHHCNPLAHVPYSLWFKARRALPCARARCSDRRPPAGGAGPSSTARPPP